MRPALQTILDALLVASEDARTLSLDAIGEAIGTEVASADDVDAMLAALASQGRSIVSPPSGDMPARLRRVLAAARELAARSGRKPSPAEIAQETGLEEGAVRAALMLGRVMGR